ncbi:MAG: hypothetical protein QM636_00395 [Rhizobium sp.]
MTCDDYKRSVIAWTPTGDREFPYGAEVSGNSLLLRLNDFPEFPLYTLFVNGREVSSFDDWPGHWRR